MAKAEDTKENADICIKFCGSCISYPGVEGEALFCARGKSSAEAGKKGCNCSFCDIQLKYGCTGMYYCIDGPCS